LNLLLTFVRCQVVFWRKGGLIPVCVVVGHPGDCAEYRSVPGSFKFVHFSEKKFLLIRTVKFVILRRFTVNPDILENRMKPRISRRSVYLLVYGLVFLCAGSVLAQILPRLFGNKIQPVPTLPPDLVQALRPSESDLEAAIHARNALIDAERAAQYAPVTTITHNFGITPEQPKMPETHVLSQEQLGQFRKEFFESPPRPIPCDDDSLPQVGVVMRFIECSSQMIAPEGMLAGQGWVLLPLAQEQKAPAAIRVRDLLDADNTPMAAGAINVTEQYSPTLMRFIDTEKLSALLDVCMSDSRSHVLMPPKMTMISGQSGRIYDMSDIPFTRSNAKDNATVEIMQEGVTVKLHPEALEDGSVRMKELHATFARVFGKERYSLDANGETVLEVPRLHTRKFNLPVTIPAGKTLLVVLPQPFDGGWTQEGPKGSRVNHNPDTLCLAVTCHVFTPETIVDSKPKFFQAKPEKIDSENASQAQLDWELREMINKPTKLTMDRLSGTIM